MPSKYNYSASSSRLVCWWHSNCLCHLIWRSVHLRLDLRAVCICFLWFSEAVTSRNRLACDWDGWLNGNSRDPYLWRADLESLAGHRLSWPRIFVVFYSPCKKMIVLPWGHGWFLQNHFQFIIYLPSIHLTLYNSASEIVVKYAMKIVIFITEMWCVSFKENSLVTLVKRPRCGWSCRDQILFLWWLVD
jgi:hypothetical protein